MKGCTRDRTRQLPTTLWIVGHPSGFHLGDAERDSVRHHFADSVLAVLSTPFQERVAFVGRLVRAPCAQTADDPARVVDDRREKDGVATVFECIHVKRIFNSVFAVALTRAANVVAPQISLDRRPGEYYRALAVGIPTTGTVLQADEVAARGLSVGNGHACAFLLQPASNGVTAGCQASVSRPELLGFQLAIQSFPARGCPLPNIPSRGGLAMGLWQSTA